jgi:nucleotide-binding universal stress UspA family protein
VKKKDHILAAAGNKVRGENYLTIKEIESSPRLARMLPSQVARRNQAIPIAADLHSTTVAMAYPEDPAAREAIRSALSCQVTFVRAETHKLDALIERCYPAAGTDPFQVLAWQRTDLFRQEDEVYIQSFVRALNGHLVRIEPEENSARSLASLEAEILQHDAGLLIYPGIPGPSPGQSAGIPNEKKLLQRLSLSILTLKSPRWPIRQILLVLQDDLIDDQAIEWGVRLAAANQACLTILPVIPPAPVVYASMHGGFPGLLDSNCPLGKHLREIAHRLDSWEISGIFKLRDEPAEWQIRSEVEEGDFDLIISGAQFHHPVERVLTQDLISPLLGWSPIPVLLAQNYPQGY